ncbi:MAG: hypothetical protein HY361_01170 [Candidatus Aenigmarchaeota archaeon]|nr:hypothetical protein [Candidatus Aenigmarchaeota archaeon]
MPAKYKMQIEKITQETEDSKSIILVPAESDDGLFDYMPGQFFTVEAEIMRPKVMAYDRSKEMMVGSGEIVNVTERKAFSAVSSPTEEGYIELLVKSEKGVFAPYFLEQYDVGDFCTLQGPQGRFMANIFQNGEKFVACWSAGSGIPSTVSLMKYAIDKELDLKVIVFDSNKTIEDIIYHERIKEFINQSENFISVFTVTRGGRLPNSNHPRVTHYSGRLWTDGENTLAKHAGGNWRSFFNTICGSSSFINGIGRDDNSKFAKLGDGIEDHLLEFGIPKNKIDKDQYYLQ